MSTTERGREGAPEPHGDHGTAPGYVDSPGHVGCGLVAPTDRTPGCEAHRVRAFWGPTRGNRNERPPQYKDSTCRTCSWRFWQPVGAHAVRCPVCVTASVQRLRKCPKCGLVRVAIRDRCWRCPVEHEHACIDCGHPVRTPTAQCRRCRPSRACPDCGKTHRSGTRLCAACCARPRTCPECHREFEGRTVRCRRCSRPPRPCDQCGREHSATNKVCNRCRTRSRVCRTCAQVFTGMTARCWRCRKASRDAAATAPAMRQ